ncbi:TPA: AlpA family phage regulatory protein, partial [Pseudomonas aeruginosa]|nr:AlpA family phage regulatory protein [Pseudomonas aeruginosa]
GGEFPLSIPLVGRSVGWIESEVQEWIQAKIALRGLREASITPAGVKDFESLRRGSG